MSIYSVPLSCVFVSSVDGFTFSSRTTKPVSTKLVTCTEHSWVMKIKICEIKDHVHL